MNPRDGRQESDGDRLERRVARLLTEVEALGAGREHRRQALIERAEARGLDRADAERAYDVALEEGLEPAYALAVVGQGIAVQVFRSDGRARASGAVEPEWIDRPPDPSAAGQERRLRETFRRLRSILDQSPDLYHAFTTFGQQPDLEPYDY